VSAAAAVARRRLTIPLSRLMYDHAGLGFLHHHNKKGA
jgi:hypothetical protein